MSFGFGFALPAYPLRGGGGNNPFNQLGPTLDLSFTGVVTDLTDPNGYTLNTNFIIPQYQIAAQYVVWETGVGLVDKTFSQIITFTRASTATYFNSVGVLTSAAIDAPRFDYNPATLAAQGLLIEEQRTNLLARSEDFGNVYWTLIQATVTANTTTAPDGATTADKLVENTATATHNIYSSGTSISAGSTLTQSVFVKAAGRSFVRVDIWDGGGNAASADFNLTTGAVGTTRTTGSGVTFSSASISAINNGWFRCTVTATTTAITYIYSRYFILNADNSASYTGDGTSGLFLWGAQLEAGAFPTSYIPTTTTALTRSADVASVNTLSPWYNQTAGTTYFEGVTFDTTTGGFPSAMTFSDGTANNRSGIVRQNATGNARMSIVSGGVAQAAADATAWTLNATTKIALAFATNDFAIVANGGVVTTDTSGSVPTVNQLRLASDWGGSGQFLNGYLRRISYYPRRLSNAELQAITV